MLTKLFPFYRVAIHSFGLGLTHKPDTMIELSNRTKASYTYVKDWMMLRECVAGCLGSIQSLSHQNVKLKMRLPEGSPARFVKIHGGLQSTRRVGGRDAEALLGDLRFGEKRGERENSLCFFGFLVFFGGGGFFSPFDALGRALTGAR